jgi:hypothetical protein
VYVALQAQVPQLDPLRATAGRRLNQQPDAAVSRLDVADGNLDLQALHPKHGGLPDRWEYFNTLLCGG